MSETVDVEQMEVSAGELLRHARESAGLHLAVLAGALKVPQRQLEALEENQLEYLPDTVYARALAASVCRTLQLDPQPVLSRMPKAGDSRLGKNEPINVPFRAPGHSMRGSWRELLTRPPVVVALALTVGAVVLLLLPLIPNRALEPSTTTAPVAALAPGLAGADTPPAAIDATVPASAVTETVPPLSGEPPQTVPVSGAVPVAVPVAGPGAGTASPAAPAPAVVKPAIAAAAVPAATDAATGAVAAAAPVIQFRTTQPSWVQVTDPRGSVYLRRMLAAGETVDISGATPLRVVIGSASGTRVRVRGIAFDLAPHARDNVARFEVR